jgi:hypothetical protein
VIRGAEIYAADATAISAASNIRIANKEIIATQERCCRGGHL